MTLVCICTKDGGDIEDWLAQSATGQDPGLAGKPFAHAYWYDGADHEFNRDGHWIHHPGAVTRVRRHTLEFLAPHLGGKT